MQLSAKWGAREIKLLTGPDGHYVASLETSVGDIDRWMTEATQTARALAETLTFEELRDQLVIQLHPRWTLGFPRAAGSGAATKGLGSSERGTIC